MIPKIISKRYLTIVMVIITFAVPMVFISSESLTKGKVTNVTVQSYQEDTPYADYNEEKIQRLVEKYSVEKDFLYYLADIEIKFNLEPFELMALIAQESEFRSITHMDGGSLSYNIAQMKLSTAKTAYMAITEYYGMDIPYPTHELLQEDKYYAALLAGGYIKYLHDKYQDKYESYTAYRWGIPGRMEYFKRNGSFNSPYAQSIVELNNSFSGKNEKYNYYTK